MEPTFTPFASPESMLTRELRRILITSTNELERCAIRWARELYGNGDGAGEGDALEAMRYWRAVQSIFTDEACDRARELDELANRIAYADDNAEAFRGHIEATHGPGALL